MREDIKMKKYRETYKKINDLYCNKYLNIKQCCEKVNITPSTYYKICKALNKRSVGTEKEKSKKGSQKSGSKTSKKNKKVENEDNEEINSDESEIVSEEKEIDNKILSTKKNEKHTPKMNSKKNVN